jgi:hypothetical protein
MQPQFKHLADWEQTDQLMQPALIRLIDNLRQMLEDSAWQGTYEAIEEPYPGQRLHLSRGEEHISVDLWQLCFCICLENYPHPRTHTQGVIEAKVDSSLLVESGDVDWFALEAKTQQVLNQLLTA